MNEKIISTPDQWIECKNLMVQAITKEFTEFSDQYHDPLTPLAHGKDSLRKLELELFYCYIQLCEILKCIPQSMFWKSPEEVKQKSMEAILLGIKNSQKKKKRKERKEDEEMLNSIIENLSIKEEK